MVPVARKLSARCRPSAATASSAPASSSLGDSPVGGRRSGARESAERSRNSALKHLRSDSAILGQLRRGPLHVARRIKLADEGNGPAGNHRQLHVVPVLAGGVIDDGPAFESGLCRAGEQEPVTRLPHGGGSHVAGHQLARGRPQRVDVDAAAILRAGVVEDAEIVLEQRLLLRIGKLHGGGRAQVDGAKLPGIGEQGHGFVLNRLAAVARRPRPREPAMVPVMVSVPSLISSSAPFI